VEAAPKFAQYLRGHVVERFSLRLHITEACTLHLLNGSGESPGTYAVHIEEAERLGQRYPVSSGLQELDAGCDFPKHAIQIHFGLRSVGKTTLCKDGRTACKGKTLNHSNKLLGFDGE